MDYSTVLSRLSGLKPRSEPNSWICRCPVSQNHKNGDRNRSGTVWVDGKTGALRCHCYARGCKWPEWMAATGTGTADWFPVADRPPDRRVRKVRDKIVATFDYTDESGALLYQVCRTDPKGFIQRRPVPGHPGEWVYSLSAGKFSRNSQTAVWFPVMPNGSYEGCQIVELPEVRKVPYHLPELMDQAKLAHPVLVTEGEGKADLLRGLGFLATCSAGGAGKWPVHFGGHLTGRRVVILPDMDDVGITHAMNVLASAVMFGAASVRIVQHGAGWEGMPKGHDVKNWLETVPAGSDKKQALVGLIKQQPEWKALAA